MIIIDFTEADMLKDIPKDIPGRVRIATREVPVRLSIAGLELFTNDEISPPRTLDMSILVLARWGLFAIRQAKRLGFSGLELDEHAAALLFQMDGEDILVHSTWKDVTVRVRHETLVEAWLQFADRVRKFVLREFPGFEKDPWWSSWFEGKEDPPETPYNGWETYFESYKEGFNHIDAIET